jgi:hypothetical protein
MHWRFALQHVSLHGEFPIFSSDFNKSTKVKFSIAKFNENPYSNTRVAARGQTEGQTRRT